MELQNLTLGDRMKAYEASYQHYLDKNLYVIVRLDGKNFSKWTKQFIYPFDDNFIDMMNNSAIKLCSQIPGFIISYLCSDEVSIVFSTQGFEKSELWFGGRTDKILSTCSAIFSSELTKQYIKYKILNNGIVEDVDESDFDNIVVPTMDCRVFQVPSYHEVRNSILFRQRDCEKNAISMFARVYFSHREVNGKNGDDKIAMMKEKGFDYSTANPTYKYGRFIYKTLVEKTYEDKKFFRHEFKIESFKISDEKERFDSLIKDENIPI